MRDSVSILSDSGRASRRTARRIAHRIAQQSSGRLRVAHPNRARLARRHATTEYVLESELLEWTDRARLASIRALGKV